MEGTSSSVSHWSFERAIDELGSRFDTSGTSYEQSVDVIQKEVGQLKEGVNINTECQIKTTQEMEDNLSSVSQRSFGTDINEYGSRTDT